MDKLKEFFQDNKRIVIAGVIGAVAIMAAIAVIKPFGDGGSGGGDDGPGITAVYAIADIPSHTIISEDMVDIKDVEEYEGANTFRYIEDVVGLETTVDIVAESSIQIDQVDGLMVDAIVDRSPIGGDLSNSVPNGLRAVIMPAGPAQGMVDYLEAGDTIDLLVTHTNDEGLETITPFQNIEVLLIDDSYDHYVPEHQPTATNDTDESDEDAPMVEPDIPSSVGSSAVILAMTPEQSEVLLNMKATGVLQSAEITLRNKEDDEIKTLKNFGDNQFEDWRNR